MQVTAEVVAMGNTAIAPLNLSETGSWLCAKHPVLQMLAERVYAWDYDNHAPMMPALRDSLIEYDRYRQANAAGFKPHPGPVRELWVMSPSQVGRLRMLATLAPLRSDRAVAFSVHDLCTFSAADPELLEDWLRCIRIGVIG